MKRTTSILLFFQILVIMQAQTITHEDLNFGSQKLIKSNNPGAYIQDTDTLVSDGNQLVGFIFHIAPEGFIITSTSALTRPVYGYSFSGDFNLPTRNHYKLKTSSFRIY